MIILLKAIFDFIYNGILSCAGLLEWLWTPLKGLSKIMGYEIAPIALFTLGGVAAVLILRVAHLVNVIAG